MGLIVDNFAGGGGTSEAIEWALGRPVDIAINHDAEAVAMHMVNHPHTKHYCEDVYSVDIKGVCNGEPVDLAWFSPDCKHFSKAKGGKPVDKNIRGLAWVVIDWAKAVQPRVIILENVEEFRTWGPVVDGQPCPKRKGETYNLWAFQLQSLGYNLEAFELRACDYGAPTIRKRLFIVARCDGLPVVCPEKTHGPGLAPYRTAADCIDWSIPCPSIFERKRPLVDNTMRRIARGIQRFVIEAQEPFIVGVGGRMGQSPERPVTKPFQTLTAKADSAVVAPYIAPVTHQGDDRCHSMEDPLRTVTTAQRGEFSCITPYLIPRHGEREGQEPRSRSVEEPMPTVTGTANGATLVSPHIVSVAHGDSGGRREYGPEEPLTTVHAGGNKHALVAAFMAQHNGGMVGHKADKPLSTITERATNQQLVTSNLIKLRGTSSAASVSEPLHTISAGGMHHAEVRAFLMKYYGTGGQHQSLFEPMHTLTAKARMGLVTVSGIDYQIIDIGMRMLSARELYRAQGFPDDYIIDPTVNGKPLTKTAQIRMCGNSVSPYPGAAIVRANVGDWAMARAG